MTHPTILTLGYSESAAVLRDCETGDICAVIAIHGQREYPVETQGMAHSLVLQFDDIEAPSTTDLIQAARIRLRQRQAAEIGLTSTPPTADHARSIIEFARSICDLNGTLLCQCQGGISRSPAAALLCLATWSGPGQEQYCVDRLLSVRPSAIPHPDLVAFGDELLHRNGRLVQTLLRTQQ